MMDFEERLALRNMMDSEVEYMMRVLNELGKKYSDIILYPDSINLGLRADLAKALLMLACADDSFELTNRKVNEVEYITGLPSQRMEKLATYVRSLDFEAFMDVISEKPVEIDTYATIDLLSGSEGSDLRFFPNYFTINYLAGQYIINFGTHSIQRQRHLLAARLTALVSNYAQESLTFSDNSNDNRQE